MLPPIFLGTSDFVKLREGGGLFVDKSVFIQDVLDRGSEVQIYPRPRRFGKTTNLSMLRTFLEKGSPYQALFHDLSIWSSPSARVHAQRYPVIALTFKGVKHTSWAEAQDALQTALSLEVQRLLPLLQHPSISPAWQARFQDIADRLQAPNTHILFEMSRALHQATGERVVLLIDEYDTPLLTAWQHEDIEPGFYQHMAGWLRALLEAGLKDNPYLFRGVLTGILRIAKESMFSGLNNIEVYSLLREHVSEPFGFTQLDVERLLEMAGRSVELPAVQAWYNGYRFGDTTVYNPWSILNFLKNPRTACQPYWLNTSDNALVRALLLGQSRLRLDVETLLTGGEIEKEIDDNIILRELNTNHFWGLLLFSGYLKPTQLRIHEGQTVATLTIPNQEVRMIWRSTFRDWLTAQVGSLEPLHHALRSGDARMLEQILTDMLELHVSQHDVKSTQDESFYHAFVLGLLVSLEKTHAVRSNREVAYGRADVMVVPKQAGQPGVVLEFKKKEKDRTIEGMATEALRQISDRRYLRELEAAGANPIHAFGIGFSGKDVVVKGPPISTP